MKNYNMTAFLSKQYQSQQMRHAIKTSLAAVLAIIIYQYFHLPNGYWAVITAVVVMQSNIESGSYELTLKLALQRFVGTACGAVIGFVIIYFFALSSWGMLLSVFLLIMLSSVASSIYKGFSMAGLTAVIVLLLAHKSPMTHNLAFIRVAEIWLGAAIAILVTLFVWPYKIVDYLQDNYLQRMTLLKKQVSGLLFVTKGEDLPAAWLSSQRKLLGLIDDDRRHASLVDSNAIAQSVSCLDEESQLAKAVSRLGMSLSKLPEQYWKFSGLRASTMDFLQVVLKVLGQVGNSNIEAETQELLQSAFANYVMAFSEFRDNYGATDNTTFDLDTTFQMTNVYDALRLISKSLTNIFLDSSNKS